MAHGNISVTVDGKTYSASYEVKRALLTVTTAHGSKSMQVRGSPAETIARMLLLELIQTEKKLSEL